MCGIFGFILKKDSGLTKKGLISMLDSIIVSSQVRGLESTGLLIKSHRNSRISVFRKSVNGKRFIRNRDYKRFLKDAFDDDSLNDGLVILGHTRIATNGNLSSDNQPIAKNGSYGVHNGIICNDNILWEKYTFLNREQLIDTELLFGLIKSKIDENSTTNLSKIFKDVFNEIEGTASFGLTFDRYNNTIIGTNCGSLYMYSNPFLVCFASEAFILNSLSSNIPNVKEQKLIPFKVESNNFCLIDEITLELNYFTFESNCSNFLKNSKQLYSFLDFTQEKPITPYTNSQPRENILSILENNYLLIRNIKRCSRCILPATHPFITFDYHGVCNYCRDYDKRIKRKPKGRDALEVQLEEIRKSNRQDNCIVMLSGGRDSCYGLHITKEVLGLRPVAFSYDWGMLTDLGRRNQARMCSKLGVEHIIVSADIKRKREYVRMNVNAFLNKPNLGTIGLFMAGDKAYHHFAKELKDRLNLPLISGGSPLEWTYFKEGFSGVKPTFEKRTFFDRFQLVKFFLFEALRNPKYINRSILDNLLAYKYYYLDVLNPINLFHYLPWNEDEVNNTLIKNYNWELSPDTTTTWRIGDGTAAFYNYIYYTVAGFTENDCFRSNQILEGIISRENALNLVEHENKPRYDSLKWYCDSIAIDLEEAIKIINSIPKLY